MIGESTYETVLDKVQTNEVAALFLQQLYNQRKELYLQGGNNEDLNNKIREFQKITNYKIIEE